jgi:hypothetical protein
MGLKRTKPLVGAGVIPAAALKSTSEILLYGDQPPRRLSFWRWSGASVMAVFPEIQFSRLRPALFDLEKLCDDELTRLEKALGRLRQKAHQAKTDQGANGDGVNASWPSNKSTDED